jgi:dTMP kinase
MAEMNHGVFLTLDGLDGTGKSTQCRLLVDWLRSEGGGAVACKDPGGTPAGEVIRALLLEHEGELKVTCEAFLFMASRVQLVSETIRPALAAGKHVVCDRFVLANVVYQGHAGGLDPALLWQWGLYSADGLEPDLTIVLDLPAEHARQRKGGPADRMERRGDDFQERVRAGFLAEAAKRPDKIRVVDANATVDVVQERIRREVSRVLAANQRA